MLVYAPLKVLALDTSPTGQSCALAFEAVANSFMNFNDPTTGTDALYDCTGVVVTFQDDGSGDIFAQMLFSGQINRVSVVGGGYLSSASAAVLNTDLLFQYNGKYRTGIVLLHPNGIGFQPDWSLYQVIGGILESPDTTIQIAIQGKFLNNQYQNLQIGSGANEGYINEYGLGFDYTFRFPYSFQILNGGMMAYNLFSNCECARTANFNNYNNSPFESGPIDYFVQFEPQFIRQQFRFTNVALNPGFYSFNPTIFGLEAAIDPVTHDQRYLMMRGFAQPASDPTSLFEFTMWFVGAPGNLPGTGYAAPVGTPDTDWQYFSLVQGVISFVSNNSGYEIAMLNSSIFPENPYGPDVIGPYLQIGTGANTLSSLYGGYFPFMYKFNYGVTWRQAYMSFAINFPVCKNAPRLNNLFMYQPPPFRPAALTSVKDYLDTYKPKKRPFDVEATAEAA